MGFFDALTRGTFKTGQDGRKLFFPWGVLGRGYIIDNEQDYQRLRWQIKAYMIVSLVLIIGVGSFVSNLVSVAITGLLIGFYLIWMLFLLGHLNRSNEKMSLRESTAFQAQAHSLVVLWLLEMSAISLVGVGIVLVVIDPDDRLVGLASLVFFGLCTAKITYMLAVRYRTPITRP